MEEWRPIPSLNGRYECSNRGRVRRTVTRRVLKPQAGTGGYLTMTVRPQPRQQKSVAVHVLIAEVWIGPRPPGFWVNHKDGDKTNCLPTNLEYVTPGANNQHAIDNGLRGYARGEQHRRAVLSAETVREIRRLHGEGLGAWVIAKRLKLGRGAVNGVIQGETWRHIC